jgi:polysaccharide chain length determinant protein (PEP-CTERM system associated)
MGCRWFASELGQGDSVLPGKQYTVEDVLHLAWRWRWLIVAPWILVAAVTFVVVKRMPDWYRSESLIQVVPARVPDGYVRATITARLGDRLPVISQQIMSRTRLERIIQEFDLYPEERKNKLMEDVVATMRGDVGVALVKGDAFQVSYLSNDARTAMKITERLASLFIEENMRDREGLAEGANQFLESQLDEARRKLIEHETKLADYKRQHNGELPSQMQSNLQVIGSTQSQVQALSESINRDRDRRLMLERMLADTSVEPAQNPFVARAPEADPSGGSAAAQLEVARAQLAAVQLRLKPEHPDVVRMKRAIKELEKKAEAEALQAPISGGAVPATPAEVARQNKIRDLQAEMAGLDQQIAHKAQTQAKLEASMGVYQGRVDASSGRELDLIELTRDYETLQRMYTSLLMKSQEAQVAANVERRQIGEQFRVIDPARVPERPYSPDRVRLNGAGAVGGLLLGLAIVALIEFRNNTFRTEQDILTVLALPVLATVPAIVTAAEQRMASRRRLITTCISISVMLIGISGAAWKFRSVLMWWR